MTERKATLARKTRETDIQLELNLDGTGQYEVSTGIAFFDHMLESFAKHGAFDLRLRATGDLAVDLHHTVEDVGIVLGQAIRQALQRSGGRIKEAAELLGLSYKTLQYRLKKHEIDRHAAG